MSSSFISPMIQTTTSSHGSSSSQHQNAGKRLAKRSILGTRVAAQRDDGKLYPGIIQAMKTCEDRLGENRYSVRFDGTREVTEYRETEIIGPGFQNVTSCKLKPGQIVYVTHCNREVQGSVLHHRPNIDQVIIQILHGGPEVKKKLEDVRVLESRKSARLIGQHNMDFSKLADFNIVHERKRLNSETNSDTSGTSSRKRRSSETLSDSSSGDELYNGLTWNNSINDERSHTPIMSECTAAMVLMNLSYSPKIGNELSSLMSITASNGDTPLSFLTDKSNDGIDVSQAVGANVMIDGSVSPSGSSGSSSGVSSLGTSWTVGSGKTKGMPSDSPARRLVEAEALLQFSNQESDEGIVSDQSSSADPEDANRRDNKSDHVQIIYQCTWPGCAIKMDICSEIERHVREKHLK